MVNIYIREGASMILREGLSTGEFADNNRHSVIGSSEEVG